MPKPKRGTISKPIKYPPIDLSRLTIKLKLKVHQHSLPKCTADKHSSSCGSHGPWVSCDVVKAPGGTPDHPRLHCLCFHLSY